MNIKNGLIYFAVLLTLPFQGLQAGCGCDASFSSNPCDNSLRADYIVVGVGTAGALMAKKLTDDRKTSVIALHNGENLTQDPIIKFTENVPITVFSALLGIPPFSISGETTPQVFADGNIYNWVAGLPLGGTSSVNAGAYCRGTNQVYSQWEEIGGPRWSVERILRIYKRLEDYHGETTNPATRGEHGPLIIRQNPSPTQVSQTFTNAITTASGFPFVLDYNDPLTPIGPSTQMQYTQRGKNGALRESSANAFLNKNVMTPDGFGVHGRQLRVLFRSTGLKTIWEGNTAIGVEFVQDGETKQVFADKGVIVCAGFLSSSFLQQSGIGPKKLLKRLGIPVIFNNPNVGRGLACQPNITLIYGSDPADTPADNSNSVFASIAWLPDPAGDPTVRKLRFSAVNPIPGLTLALFDLVQPVSRGTIRIDSDTLLDPPVVNPGLLSNSEDFDLFVRGFQIYIQGINNALPAGYFPIFPDNDIINDFGLLSTFIRNSVAPTQHWQSHCRLAPLNQGGVVNSKGRVYGTKNLYVADDSISIVNMDGSPMASAYLIAFNIAQILQGN